MRKPDSELTEDHRLTLPGQCLNNLNKWLTRAMSSLVVACVVCPDLRRMPKYGIDRYWGYSRHDLLQRICLLLTQSGDGPLPALFRNPIRWPDLRLGGGNETAPVHIVSRRRRRCVANRRTCAAASN